jgi:hypothetical protein
VSRAIVPGLSSANDQHKPAGVWNSLQNRPPPLAAHRVLSRPRLTPRLCQVASALPHAPASRSVSHSSIPRSPSGQNYTPMPISASASSMRSTSNVGFGANGHILLATMASRHSGRLRIPRRTCRASRGMDLPRGAVARAVRPIALLASPVRARGRRQPLPRGRTPAREYCTTIAMHRSLLPLRPTATRQVSRRRR